MPKQRGSSWQGTVHHKGKRYRLAFPTELEAKTWELKAEAALLAGETIPDTSDRCKTLSGPSSLKELRQMTYDKYWKDSKSFKTALINSNKVLETIGESVAPSAVTETTIDNAVFAWEAEGASNSTINRRLSALSKMLTFAYERNFIQRKPKMDRKREPENRIRFLSELEEKELMVYFKHIGEPEMTDLIAVALDTGLRRGELLRLAPRDIFETSITVWVAKSGRPRTIPLTNRAKEILDRLAVKAIESGNTKLFSGWTPDKVIYKWNLGRSHLGLMSDPQFVFHSTRHTFCSRLIQRGVSIVVVSELAGHSSIQMTMKYAHLCPKNLSDGIAVLN